jgi:hypothetical protein
MDSYRQVLRSGSHPTFLNEGCEELTPPTGRQGRWSPSIPILISWQEGTAHAK